MSALQAFGPMHEEPFPVELLSTEEREGLEEYGEPFVFASRAPQGYVVAMTDALRLMDVRSVESAPVKVVDVGAEQGTANVTGLALVLGAFLWLVLLYVGLRYGTGSSLMALGCAPIMALRPLPLRDTGHPTVDTYAMALEINEEASLHGRPSDVRRNRPPCVHCGAYTEVAPNGVITASGTTGCAGSLHGHAVNEEADLPHLDQFPPVGAEEVSEMIDGTFYPSEPEEWVYCVADDGVFVVDCNRDAFTLEEATRLARALKLRYMEEGDLDPVVCVHPYLKGDPALSA